MAKALITGASTGIGATYADRLARRGADLVLVARDKARLDALAARLTDETGVGVDVLRADLTDAADLSAVATRLADDAAIDLLVNNAGISLNGGVLEEDAARLQTLIALNVTAPTLLAAAAAKAFVARGGGTIVNVSSVLALAPEISDDAYAGSKSYLLSLSLSMQKKITGKGLHVQAVLPGATRTEIWERSGKDVEGMLPPEWIMEVGDLVDAALLGLDRGETVTIPPLADLGQYEAYEAARLAMTPNLSRRDVAPRYRETVEA